MSNIMSDVAVTPKVFEQDARTIIPHRSDRDYGHRFWGFFSMMGAIGWFLELTTLWVWMFTPSMRQFYFSPDHTYFAYLLLSIGIFQFIRVCMFTWSYIQKPNLDKFIELCILIPGVVCMNFAIYCIIVFVTTGSAMIAGYPVSFYFMGGAALILLKKVFYDILYTKIKIKLLANRITKAAIDNSSAKEMAELRATKAKYEEHLKNHSRFVPLFASIVFAVLCCFTLPQIGIVVPPLVIALSAAVILLTTLYYAYNDWKGMWHNKDDQKIDEPEKKSAGAAAVNRPPHLKLKEILKSHINTHIDYAKTMIGTSAPAKMASYFPSFITFTVAGLGLAMILTGGPLGLGLFMIAFGAIALIYKLCSNYMIGKNQVSDSAPLFETLVLINASPKTLLSYATKEESLKYKQIDPTANKQNRVAYSALEAIKVRIETEFPDDGKKERPKTITKINDYIIGMCLPCEKYSPGNVSALAYITKIFHYKADHKRFFRNKHTQRFYEEMANQGIKINLGGTEYSVLPSARYVEVCIDNLKMKHDKVANQNFRWRYNNPFENIWELLTKRCVQEIGDERELVVTIAENNTVLNITSPSEGSNVARKTAPESEIELSLVHSSLFSQASALPKKPFNNDIAMIEMQTARYGY